MSSKYKVGENAIPHFVTFSVIGWIDVFSREQYKELVVESLKYWQQYKGMVLHAWVIMYTLSSAAIPISWKILYGM